jgi:hypothetical protein
VLKLARRTLFAFRARLALERLSRLTLARLTLLTRRAVALTRRAQALVLRAPSLSASDKLHLLPRSVRL